MSSPPALPPAFPDHAARPGTPTRGHGRGGIGGAAAQYQPDRGVWARGTRVHACCSLLADALAQQSKCLTCVHSWVPHTRGHTATLTKPLSVIPHAALQVLREEAEAQGRTVGGDEDLMLTWCEGDALLRCCTTSWQHIASPSAQMPFLSKCTGLRSPYGSFLAAPAAPASGVALGDATAGQARSRRRSQGRASGRSPQKRSCCGGSLP
jgi:hypothetical protein